MKLTNYLEILCIVAWKWIVGYDGLSCLYGWIAERLESSKAAKKDIWSQCFGRTLNSDAKFWSSELTNSFLFLPAPNFSVMLCRSVPFLAAVSNCNGSFGSKIPGKRVGGGGDAETLLQCDSCQLVLSLFGSKPRKIMICRLVGVRS